MESRGNFIWPVDCWVNGIMREMLILTDKCDFVPHLTRGEKRPRGVRLPEQMAHGAGPDFSAPIRVNLGKISSTAFAMWILRKVRSIPGNHRIVIDGRVMVTRMPGAIDEIAGALVRSSVSSEAAE